MYFMGSSEYFTNQGGNATPWLDAACRDIFGRPADPGANSSWLLLLG
jgi:hypothetical protein